MHVDAQLDDLMRWRPALAARGRCLCGERNLAGAQHGLDHPGPERLAEHARLLDELERVGTWLSLATGTADFPDRPTAELVGMTLQDLKDARALWHGNMTRGRREEILRAVFNEP